MAGRVINVYCRCGYKLFKYYKDKKGRLIKCYLRRIIVDNVGVVNLALKAKPICTNCKKNLGTITIIRGKPALKLNQGTITPLRT